MSLTEASLGGAGNSSKIYLKLVDTFYQDVKEVVATSLPSCRYNIQKADKFDFPDSLLLEADNPDMQEAWVAAIQGELVVSLPNIHYVLHYHY